jgi:hypothetical protein
MRPHHKLKVWILAGVAIIAIIALPFIPRIPQDLTYHELIDTREVLGIPNFWNVVTNIPFFLVSLLGFTSLRSDRRIAIAPALRLSYTVFLVGVMLVSVGSSYYHYAPSNTSLVWDRLPMAISFMALLVMVIGDSVSPILARKLFWPLLLLGLGSVIYWHVTELMGVGDLRPYGLVQFLPMVLLLLIIILFGTQSLRVGFLWATCITYGLAKVAEHFDRAVYAVTGLMSGHSIKHVLAALAIFWIVLACWPNTKLSTRVKVKRSKSESGKTRSTSALLRRHEFIRDVFIPRRNEFIRDVLIPRSNEFIRYVFIRSWA